MKLELERLSKHFKNKIAVEEVNTVLTEGIYGFLGANGAGKTTLLNILGITVLSFAPVASIPLLSMLVFLCSLAVAWLIHWLPFIGRWLT